MQDTYRAVRRPAAAEIKVRGSRFLADVYPVDSVEAAEEGIAAVRRREHAATHHCSAYRVGPAGDASRAHDDGEPSGTAGAPILRQIDARGLTNTLVVVTRYYGGTKFGTGGLARAYGEAARQALEAAPVVTRVLRHRLRLRFAYDDTSPAMQTINRYDARVASTHYSEVTELEVEIRRSDEEAFVQTFTDALGGRGAVERLD